MTNLTFDNLRYLNLLWAVGAVILLGVYGAWQRRRALRRFADLSLLPALAPWAGWLRPMSRLALVAGALAALVAALIGPRWGEATQKMVRRNMDVLVLLDVSRSMLARDIAPNRLERAKLAIRDDLLPALGGDRIGLIAFAGKPSVVCPLTTDYGFFRLALADVTTDSAPVGGTLIGDAIRKAGELFKKEIDSHKIILLITDGEDQESLPVEAASGVWQEQKIPVIALALGDPEQGARIPVGSEKSAKYLEYGGKEVWSKANFAELERVAKVSNAGRFIAVGTSNFDLGDIFTRVARLVRAETQSEEQNIRQPARFHPFAVLALVLILIESFIRDGVRLPPRAGARAGNGAAAGGTARRGRAGATAAAVVLLAGVVAARADSPRDLIAKGNDLYAAGKYAEALQAYVQAAALPGAASLSEVLHDQAAAQFKLGKIDDARELWTRAKSLGDAKFEARTRYNLGNCDYAQAVDGATQDPQGALEKLAKAGEQYRAALQLDPDLQAARVNLELMHLLKKQIEEQLQQSPQSQPSSQPSQQSKDKQDQKDQQQDPNQPRDPNQAQDPNKQPHQQQTPHPNQACDPNQAPDPNQAQEPNQPRDPNEAQDPNQQPQNEQQQQEQQEQQPNSDEPNESQHPPDPNQSQAAPEPNENAAPDPNGTQPPQPQPAAESQPADPNQTPAGMVQLTPAQVERLLQKIRDAEKARRAQLARQRAAKQKPVERDW